MPATALVDGVRLPDLLDAAARRWGAARRTPAPRWPGSRTATGSRCRSCSAGPPPAGCRCSHAADVLIHFEDNRPLLTIGLRAYDLRGGAAVRSAGHRRAARGARRRRRGGAARRAADVPARRPPHARCRRDPAARCGSAHGRCSARWPPASPTASCARPTACPARTVDNIDTLLGRSASPTWSSSCRAPAASRRAAPHLLPGVHAAHPSSARAAASSRPSPLNRAGSAGDRAGVPDPHTADRARLEPVQRRNRRPVPLRKIPAAPAPPRPPARSAGPRPPPPAAAGVTGGTVCFRRTRFRYAVGRAQRRREHPALPSTRVPARGSTPGDPHVQLRGRRRPAQRVGDGRVHHRHEHDAAAVVGVLPPRP